MTMRTLVLLLGGLLLATTAAADDGDAQDAPVRLAVAVAQNAAEAVSPCLDAARSAQSPVAACEAIIPDCHFAFVTIHQDPFWLEPELRPGCVDEWVSFVLRLLQP